MARALQKTNGDGFFAIMRRQTIWAIYPYGWWTEDSGSYVVFDKSYRPICRVGTDGAVEILPSDLFINRSQESFFYTGAGEDHPYVSASVRNKLYGVIARLGLEDEMRSRRILAGNRQLPCAVKPEE